MLVSKLSWNKMCADINSSDEESSDSEYESQSYVNLKSVDKAIEQGGTW